MTNQGEDMQGRCLNEETATDDAIMIIRLRSALSQSAEAMEEMINYIPVYFQMKWNYQGDIDVANETLAAYKKYAEKYDALYARSA